MTPEEIAELITRRRRQLLVHSIIYYRMNDNLITDNQWAKWAIELEELQRDYPEIAKNCPRAKEFENFDHSTGYNLPLNDPYAVATARRLLDMKYKKGEIKMINENDIRRHIIAALLNEPILGRNYVDYHNENDECCVRIMYPSKHFDIIIKEVPEEAYFETYDDYRE